MGHREDGRIGGLVAAARRSPAERSALARKAGLNRWKGYHGAGNTPEFYSWSAMMKRCYNQDSPSWKNYGARGITVCDRWHLFKNFLFDMGKRPSPDHTLDREDNDGNYNLDNCHWATRTEQCRNQRSCQLNEELVELIRLCHIPSKQLAKFLGVSQRTINSVRNYETWIPDG